MNIIDIIILLILAYALFEGFREGIVVQACSIVGIAVGIWCGSKYGDTIANFLQIESDYSSTWGFIITLIVAILLVGIVARIARQILHFAGLSAVDKILGMALSLFKYVVIMSLMLSAFGFINSNVELVNSNTLAKSKLYQPIVNTTKWATPAWNWTVNQINQAKQETIL